MEKMREQLKKPIDGKHLKPHPTKDYLTVISPMAVIERLNDVIKIGGWTFECEHIAHFSEEKKRKDGTPYTHYTAAAKGILKAPQHGIHIEQFGGSDNDDLGDALKGAATDAMTKCASYLEIGFEIYSGEKDTKKPVQNTKPSPRGGFEPTEKQMSMIKVQAGQKDMTKELKREVEDVLSGKLKINKKHASEIIEQLVALPAISDPLPDDIPF